MRTVLLAAAAAVALTLAPSAWQHSQASDEAGALLAGAVIGAAAGAIVASAADHNHYRPHRHHVPRRYRPGPFSPHRHIVCYPAMRYCVRNNGRPAPGWTRREYGR